MPRWQVLPDAPSARQEVAAALVGDEVFVAGGFDAAGAATARVDVFNIQTQRWRAGPALPEARHHPAGTAYRGQAYIVGGFAADGSSSDDVFRLDGDRWARVALLNHPRGAAAAVVANDRLYVFGGQGPSGSLVREPEVFEPDATSHWRDLAPIPTPRHHLAVDASAQFIFAAGGRAPSEGRTVNVTALERYDTEKNAWEELPALPVGRSGHGVALINDRLVLIGGEVPGGPDSSIARVDIFDVQTRMWSQLADMPRPRHGVGVLANQGKIYVFLGAGRAGLQPAKQSDVLLFER